MSGEFGEYTRGGYFHEKVRSASEDALSGRDELTRKMGALLAALVPVCEDISYSEEYDTSSGNAILGAMNNRGAIESAYQGLVQYIKLFDDVVAEAIRAKEHSISKPEDAEHHDPYEPIFAGGVCETCGTDKSMLYKIVATGETLCRECYQKKYFMVDNS